MPSTMSCAPDRYAVIGHPVDHSRSPEIHARFAAQTGENLRYDLLPAAEDAFRATVDVFFESGGAGLNVTLPFKRDAARFAHELSARAARAGAVNTLARGADGQIFGDNTDGAGLVRDLRDNLGVAIAGARVLVLGAGGAVRGVLAPLAECRPAALTVANRSPDKATALAAEFADLMPVGACALAAVPPGWDIVINAISAGLSERMPTLPDAAVCGAAVAYDMIYRDTPTPFLRWAETRGVAFRRDGLGMLVEQAGESFHLWRGVRADTAAVIRALRPRDPNAAGTLQ